MGAFSKHSDWPSFWRVLALIWTSLAKETLSFTFWQLLASKLTVVCRGKMYFKILAFFFKNTKKLICFFKTEQTLIPLNLMKGSGMGKCLCQSYKAAFWWTLVSNDFGVKLHIQLELLRLRRPGSNQSWNPSKYSAARAPDAAASWARFVVILNCGLCQTGSIDQSHSSIFHETCDSGRVVWTVDYSMQASAILLFCHEASLWAKSSSMNMKRVEWLRAAEYCLKYW